MIRIVEPKSLTQGEAAISLEEIFHKGLSLEWTTVGR